MITLGGAMHEKSFFEDTRYDLDYLGIGHMNKEQLLDYMRNGNYTDRSKHSARLQGLRVILSPL